VLCMLCVLDIRTFRYIQPYVSERKIYMDKGPTYCDLLYFVCSRFLLYVCTDIYITVHDYTCIHVHMEMGNIYVHTKL
jgi:hypothetical protein